MNNENNIVPYHSIPYNWIIYVKSRTKNQEDWIKTLGAYRYLKTKVGTMKIQNLIKKMPVVETRIEELEQRLNTKDEEQYVDERKC